MRRSASLAALVLLLSGPLGHVTVAAAAPKRIGGWPADAARAADAAATAGAVVRGDAGLSLDAAIAMVERRFNARVVRADTLGAGPQTVYVLRLLSAEGRVWTVRVNAASGAVQ